MWVCIDFPDNSEKRMTIYNIHDHIQTRLYYNPLGEVKNTPTEFRLKW